MNMVWANPFIISETKLNSRLTSNTYLKVTDCFNYYDLFTNTTLKVVHYT